MIQLAILGGQPVRTKPFPSWPVFYQNEEQTLLEVLRSGKWWRFSYGEGVELREPEPGQPRSKVAEFQEAFAGMQQVRYGFACANGTAALEVWMCCKFLELPNRNAIVRVAEPFNHHPLQAYRPNFEICNTSDSRKEHLWWVAQWTSPTPIFTGMSTDYTDFIKVKPGEPLVVYDSVPYG